MVFTVSARNEFWGQSPAYPIIFLVAVDLSVFIYFAVLGALAGLLFQGLFRLFRKLKRRDAVHQAEPRP
jgi:hypothetical protein